jgi:hypothetical protein
MLVEEALFIVFILAVVLVAVPLALGRRPFWLASKNDPVAQAKARKRVAQVRLEALQAEKEAAEMERRYERAVDEMLEEDESKENKRGS